MTISNARLNFYQRYEFKYKYCYIEQIANIAGT